MNILDFYKFAFIQKANKVDLEFKLRLRFWNSKHCIFYRIIIPYKSGFMDIVKSKTRRFISLYKEDRFSNRGVVSITSSVEM